MIKVELGYDKPLLERFKDLFRSLETRSKNFAKEVEHYNEAKAKGEAMAKELNDEIEQFLKTHTCAIHKKEVKVEHPAPENKVSIEKTTAVVKEEDDINKTKTRQRFSTKKDLKRLVKSYRGEPFKKQTPNGLSYVKVLPVHTGDLFLKTTTIGHFMPVSNEGVEKRIVYDAPFSSEKGLVSVGKIVELNNNSQLVKRNRKNEMFKVMDAEKEYVFEPKDKDQLLFVVVSLDGKATQSASL